MTKRIWIFLYNTFLVATKGNFKKMDVISNYTDGALQSESADPEINDMWTFLNPFRQAFHNLYVLWKSAGDQREGATQLYADLMDSLSEKIGDWDVAIQTAYKRNTPRYTALLPNKRRPFQSGTYEEKTVAFEALRESIGSDTALADVKLEIETFLTDADNALKAQTGWNLEVQQKSDTIEIARTELGEALYKVLGMLIVKFFQSPAQIERFFALRHIRIHLTGGEEENQPYYVEIPAGGKAVANLSFSPEDRFLITNVGDTSVSYYTAAAPDEAPPSSPTLLPDEDSAEVTGATLGAPDKKYLIFINNNTTEAGEVEIMLV